MDSDFNRFTEIKDISEVNIDRNLDPSEKKKEYLGKVGSSSLHKVGDIQVECVYGEMKLENMLADLICK